MQDYKRAIIVGSTTYGKGTVQKMVELDQFINPMQRLSMFSDSAGGAQATSLGDVKLTMEKFYRVNGGSTQLKGVTPDIPIPDALDSYDEEDLGERHNRSALPWDVIPPASYKPTNSVGNLQQLAALSQSRVANDPTFELIQENSEYFKKKKEDNVVSLNEAQYKKEQEEVKEKSDKLEELQKKAVVLDMVSPPADLENLIKQSKENNDDTTAISKNKEWLKNHSKDIYIAETVNILNDLKRSGVTLNSEKK